MKKEIKTYKLAVANLKIHIAEIQEKYADEITSLLPEEGSYIIHRRSGEILKVSNHYISQDLHEDLPEVGFTITDPAYPNVIGSLTYEQFKKSYNLVK